MTVRISPQHTQRQWEGKFFRCQMCCWYCRIPLTIADATKDHLTPLARGGSDQISNIVPACIDCNRLKGDMTEAEFREERKRFSTAARNVTSVPSSANEMLSRIADHDLLRELEKERNNIEWWRN